MIILSKLYGSWRVLKTVQGWGSRKIAQHVFKVFSITKMNELTNVFTNVTLMCFSVKQYLAYSMNLLNTDPVRLTFNLSNI